MTAVRLAAALVGLAVAVTAVAACEKQPRAPEAAVAAPPSSAAVAPASVDAAVDAVARGKMVANPDGLSLVERIAKRKAAEQKLAAELAEAENMRLLKFDKAKLPQHRQLFTFIKKTRGQYDALESKLRGAKKAQAAAAIEKFRASSEASLVATGKKLAAIDPRGGNSNVTTDFDVMLNALANDYPAALTAALDGDTAPLTEQRAELDRRTVKVEGWLARARNSKK